MKTIEHDSQPGADEQAGKSNAEFYRSLAADTQPTEVQPAIVQREATPEDYVAQAKDIFRTIANSKDRQGIKGAHDTAQNVYIEEEEQADLRQYSKDLLDAPHIAREKYVASQQLEALRNKRDTLRERGSDLSESETGEYRAKVEEMCRYNHHLRDMITKGEIDREVMESWLLQGGVSDAWVRKNIMPGVAAEIAAHEFFEGMADVAEVRYGTVEEDMRDGSDLFVTLDTKQVVRVDVKSGRAVDAQIRRGVMQVVVPSQAVEGFTIMDKDVIEKMDNAFFDELDNPKGSVAWTSS